MSCSTRRSKTLEKRIELKLNKTKKRPKENIWANPRFRKLETSQKLLLFTVIARFYEPNRLNESQWNELIAMQFTLTDFVSAAKGLRKTGLLNFKESYDSHCFHYQITKKAEVLFKKKELKTIACASSTMYHTLNDLEGEE